MASAPLVSVIVPVYNPGQYLTKCLDSVCGQTLKDLEIVCVEDGSTDASPAILQDYAAKDPRITVLTHAHNRGCAAARNTGMAAARGTYIHFLDSDDWIDPGYLEEFVTIAEREGLPLVMNSHILLEVEGAGGPGVRFEPGSFDETIGFSTTGYVEYPPNIGNFTYSNCCCLYRRDYLEGLGVHFPEGLDYTDNYFHIATFLPQERVYLTNTNAYHYEIHVDSICGKDAQLEHKYDIFEVYHHIYEYYQQRGFLDTRKLNFFELSRHWPKFLNKEAAFVRLYRLFHRMEEDVQKRPHFYGEEEKKFFHDVVRSRRYLFYEYLLTPQTSRLPAYFPELRKTVRADMTKRTDIYRQKLAVNRRLAALRNNVKVNLQDKK